MYTVLTPTFRSRSPTMFKAEILADGVKGVLVEDFKGIPKINLHLHCSYLSKWTVFVHDTCM